MRRKNTFEEYVRQELQRLKGEIRRLKSKVNKLERERR